MAGAQSQSITDAPGDFLPTYTGPQNDDADVLSAFAGYNASTGLVGLIRRRLRQVRRRRSP